MNLIRLLIFFFVFGSCTNGNKIEFSEFKNEVQISLKSADISEHFRSANINLLGNYLVLLNTFGSKEQIHIYDTTFMHIVSAGKVGQGPCEIHNPFQGIVFSPQKQICVMDIGRWAVLKFKMDSILKNPGYFPESHDPIPVNSPFIISYKKLSDSVYAYIKVQQKEELISFFNNQGENINSLSIKDDYKLHFDEIEDNYDQLYYLFAKHPDKNLYAIGYRYSDIVTIVDDKGKILKTIKGPTKIDQIPDIDIPNSYEFCRAIQCDNKYIYRLYSGKKMFIKNVPGVQNPDQIHIYDWEGNPLYRINLNTSVTSFCFDKEAGRLYAFSADSTDIVYSNFSLK